MVDLDNYKNVSFTTDFEGVNFQECFTNFFSFAIKYLKVHNPTKGLIPFEIYPYHDKLFKEIEEERFTIVKKPRQVGIDTFMVLYVLWKCMFKVDQRFMFICKTDSEALAMSRITYHALCQLPDYLQPEMGNHNDHEIKFQDTNSSMLFWTWEACCAKAVTHLIISEAAFIQDMDNNWKAMYPLISTGGKCTVVSTVNGKNNWFYKVWEATCKKHNKFKPISIDYTEHPMYTNPFLSELRKDLGEKGFGQEILCEFL